MRSTKGYRYIFIYFMIPVFMLAQEKNTTQVEQEVTTVKVPQIEDEEEVVELDLKPGDEAPKFTLKTTTGGYELLGRWCGEKLSRPASQPTRHVVVVSFFATWCKPCMKELPHLQNLYEKYEGKDIKFFLIDITEATRTVEGNENSPEAGPFLKKKGITIPVLLDVYGIAKKEYGVVFLPRLFVIDKYRKIRLVKKGFQEEEKFEEELSSVINNLLAE
ncbi:MAG: TlpA family protein disulfide reductase [Candidatus Marinimicrobia bacterium]|nr:TlpA family protein disulfide reductase [Candidatus Neomarinimicrobiota bacterium]